LVHVIELVSLPNPLYPHYGAGHAIGPEQRRLQHAELTVRLHALVPEEAQTLGIATRVEILEDPNIAGAITGIAERLGVDLICMSSHGRTGLSSVLAGSVARAVMAQSRRPLLLIRPSRD
jgi:nucleotide-binding universal stress UspA family protein